MNYLLQNPVPLPKRAHTNKQKRNKTVTIVGASRITREGPSLMGRLEGGVRTDFEQANDNARYDMEFVSRFLRIWRD